MTFDVMLQMIYTALMAVAAFSLNNMSNDIREIRKSIADHIKDHAAHCKHPTKGC